MNQTNCLYSFANEAPTVNHVVDLEIFDKWLLPETVASQKRMVSLCIPKAKTGEPIHLDLLVSKMLRLCNETLCFVNPPLNSCDMDMSQNLGPINPHVSWVISFTPETSYLRCLSYHLLPSGKVFFSRFPRIAEGLTEKECERSNERIK